MIDMNKQYRYRNAPEGQELRRILCTDRNHRAYPIISENGIGEIFHHNKDGKIAPMFHEAENFSLIEITKYDHIKKGELVMCWDDDRFDATIQRFYYAEDERVYTKNNECMIPWQNCETIADYAEKYLK